jgi:hypothetical protein
LPSTSFAASLDALLGLLVLVAGGLVHLVAGVARVALDGVVGGARGGAGAGQRQQRRGEERGDP